MFQETEAQLKEILLTDDAGFVLCHYHLRVFDKNKQKIILSRYISTEELAKDLFEKQVKIYHNKDFAKVIISLHDIEKCTNIEYYDSDDNI